jgi:Ca2+-transporting ATPase
LFLIIFFCFQEGGRIGSSKGSSSKSGENQQYLHKGLSAEQVEALRKEHGENRLPAEKKRSAWAIVFSQVKSPLVYIILVAAGISLAVGELSDFIIIMAVVVIDVVLGFIQEYQAQQTYAALKGLLRLTTTVIRDGKRQEVDVWELVPQDLVILGAGEKIPGDGVMIEANKISVDEAILTGESEPVNKTDQDGKNLVFMGTAVITGRGIMKVIGTGKSTELGKIATSLGEPTEEETPLQVRLKNFSKTFTYVVVGFTTIILVVGIIMGRSILDMVRTSIILAIAAVPEGLLIAVTVILVLGMRKVLKRNGLVKRLLAVETLGSVTTICTDKTGTLTQGMMRVTKADLADRQHALQTMVLCNNLEGPVDIALWEYAKEQLHKDPQDIFDRSKRFAEEFFTSETKHMVTYTKVGADRHYFLKGAPEIILDQCDIEPARRQEIMHRVDEWAKSGLRLIGLAYRTGGELEEHAGYIWAGLVGMEDPIREEVIDSISVAHRAGIDVKMITGDYRLTAERIARNIGIMQEGDELIEGDDLEKLDDQTLQAKVKRISVFARIRPQDKLRIIKALQANGEIAAMVGDGVNDAPALKRANIGVVVGSATDVAKETADLILLDNSFKTIVAAIEEGRVIFENIQKVVAFVLSNSFAEVITIFMAMMLGWPAPLLVAQILWIHLICDGPSDIVLGFEPKENGIMMQKPKRRSEPILTPLGGGLIATISIGSSLTALALFYYYCQVLGDLKTGQTIVFASFAIKTLIYIFAYRSMSKPLFRMNPITVNKPLIYAVLSGIVVAVLPIYVPWLRSALGVTVLHLNDWVWVGVISVGLLLVIELGKWLNKLLLKRRDAHGSKVPA